MTVYIGLDPGGTTGVALLRDEKVDAYTIPESSPLRVGFSLAQFIRDANTNAVVICEQTIPYGTQFPKELRLNIQLEGAILYVAENMGIPVFFQPPGVRKAWEWLAIYRLTTSNINASQHSIDAYAHVLAYLSAKPTSEEVEWKRTFVRTK